MVLFISSQLPVFGSESCGLTVRFFLAKKPLGYKLRVDSYQKPLNL